MRSHHPGLRAVKSFPIVWHARIHSMPAGALQGGETSTLTSWGRSREDLRQPRPRRANPMSRTSLATVSALLLVTACPVVSLAEDISAKKLSIKDNADPAKRSVQ